MGIEVALASVSARTALHYPGEGRRTTARDFSVDTQRFELPNGLIVLLAPDRGFSNVLVWTTFRAGTLHEPAGRSGLAHLVEHLMATGPTAQTDYQTLLETRGARCPRRTPWRDSTVQGRTMRAPSVTARTALAHEPPLRIRTPMSRWNGRSMAAMAQETAYYLNTRLPRLALIAKGIRFPAGQWIRIAGGSVMPWHVEELVPDLFPALRGRPVPFRVLLTDFDVIEYEREVRWSEGPTVP